MKTLEEVLQHTGNIAEFLWNQQTGPNVYPGVPAEYTSWRDEVWAWQHSAVLFNQSYHMVDLAISGPDAFAMLNHLGVNSFNGFSVDKAKQWAPVTPEGYVIGDGILFHLEEDQFNLVGRAPSIEWVEYQAATGSWNVKVERDERSALRTDGRRKSYRFQIQGPNAFQVMSAALGGEVPQLKFFNMARLKIAGRDVRALRHGMAGQPGYELFGPWDDYAAVHKALVGGRAYSANTLESGWIPSPLPAVYTGDSLKAYREWLPATCYEARASIGGSFVSRNIEDYYLTPWDLGYGPFVKFDHDFIGRAALEKKAAGPHRRKVTLALDNEDFLRVMSSTLTKGERAKWFEFPSAVYSMHPYDQVLADGRMVGLSTWVGYSFNEGRMLTLAMLDEAHAEVGTRVSLLWGEPNGGSRKPTVERHVQTEIKAIVSPLPFAEVARDSYADSWRTRQAS